jgi:excisionase family DNA binding protein
MKILDLQQAALLLQINPESLRRLAIRGEIPSRKPGRKWLFVETHLEEWLKEDYAASGEMAHIGGDVCPRIQLAGQAVTQHQRGCLAAGLYQGGNHQFPLARPQAYLGVMARAERYQPAGTHGTGRVEVVPDGFALCPSGRRPPEKRGREYYKFSTLRIAAGITGTGGESPSI